MAASLPDAAFGPPAERPYLAIALRLLAMANLGVMFALIKYLGAHGVNVIEMLFYRQFFALPVICGWIALTAGVAGFRPRKLGGHVSRTAIGLTSMGLNFAAVIMLPLAESQTIAFTAPIVATIISALILKEKTGIHRWMAVLIGFAGVVIVAQPGKLHLPPLGLAAAIAAAISIASISIILRALSRTENATAIVFWFTLLSVPPMSLLMIGYGQGHGPAIFGLILIMATMGGIGQLLMTTALSLGRVSLVLPMDYTSIIWAVFFGWLIWGVLPMLSTWIGASLIIASGLYIVWREHKAGQMAQLRAQAEADAAN